MTDLPNEPSLRGTRGLRDRLGDQTLKSVAFTAALLGLITVVAIAVEVLRQSKGAFDRFGLGFIVHSGWDVTHSVFGARDWIYGTLVTGAGALLVGTPLAVAIALYLSELAPRGLRTVVGALVELLAAIPSVVLGLFGIIVLGPLVKDYAYPALSGPLGFIPLFHEVGNVNGSNIMTAVVVLTIMVVPIIASVTLEVLTAVPNDLKEGALALGATRWEMIRGVMLPTAKPGIVAAVILGFGRAVGEAIAVTQVIGGANRIHYWSLFETGDTLASKIAAQFQNTENALQASALLYLGAILLVVSLIVNTLAQLAIRPLTTGKQRRRFGIASFRIFESQRMGGG
jgi:phosphate transport system permease protein